MASPSSPIDRPSTSSDIHVPPPPSVYIPRQNPSIPAFDDHLSALPARPMTHATLRWQGIQRGALELVTRVGSRKRRLGDLEMGQEARTQTVGRSSVACVFCLASRDVCIQLGINNLPVLFNTFGEEAWKILESLCSECRLLLRKGCGDEALSAGQPDIHNCVPSSPSDLHNARCLIGAGNSYSQQYLSPLLPHVIFLSHEFTGRHVVLTATATRIRGLIAGGEWQQRTSISVDTPLKPRGNVLFLHEEAPCSQRAVGPDQEGGPREYQAVNGLPSPKRGHESWNSVLTLCNSVYEDPQLRHALSKKSQLEDCEDAPTDVNDDDHTTGVMVHDFGAHTDDHILDEKKQAESDNRPCSVTFENSYGSRVLSYGGAINSSRSSRTIVGYNDGRPDSSLAVPDKTYPQPYRGLRHRLFIVYRRLFSLVFLGNVAALIVIAAFPQINRDWTATISVINLTIAVLVRQDCVINALYAVFCSVPRSWPLWIRQQCAKIYHLGGVHSGAATAAVVWFIASVAYSMKRPMKSSKAISVRTLVMSWTAIVLLLAMLVAAFPALRKRYHNRFELVHRFAGWTALAIFWAQSVLIINDRRDKRTQTLGAACIRSPNFWLLLVVTLSIASPWMYLRKVDVHAEVLSDHAVRLHFDYVTPVPGSFTRMSERPLVEWHSFAVIPVLEPTPKRPKGYSVIVSNAGDWTKRQIQHPPTKLWIRGLPTCGVMHVARLFNRLVLVGTGSGIGPLLSFLQPRPVPIRLIWSTPDPIKTFGEEICRDAVAADPDCIIHDTKLLGRPDLVRMAYQAAVEFEAEAVIIIANERITKKVVYGLETRGLAAYGAIWDS